jgi:formylmethanofuran dehydrogenase subunit E
MKAASLEQLLGECASTHTHLCPRQVLGVRMGLYGAQLSGLAAHQDKQLLVIAETDGCFIDGLGTAAGVSVGRRTLRVEYFGKIAATFIDTHSESALRLAPRLDVRRRALEYAPRETQHYFAQLKGYQCMPDELLFSVQKLHLTAPLHALLGRPGVRTNCCQCGEEIINECEVIFNGLTYCRTCIVNVAQQDYSSVWQSMLQEVATVSLTEHD